MKKIIPVLLIFSSFKTIGQHKVNFILKRQLDSVMVLDQKYRDTLTLLMDPQKSEATAKNLSLTVVQASGRYWKLQNRLDSLNVVFIESIFGKYGYPGKTLVDTPANEAAWYIIQHSPKIHRYISLIKKAADNHELPFHLYAMMLDRDLVNEGKEQVYGTQITCRVLKNGKNECFVWPIQDAATVNMRRKRAGFYLTVEQNAARLDVVYRVVNMDEVK
jgi:hypothetical protein